jgi:hypothetical protein
MIYAADSGLDLFHMKIQELALSGVMAAGVDRYLMQASVTGWLVGRRPIQSFTSA